MFLEGTSGQTRASSLPSTTACAAAPGARGGGGCAPPGTRPRLQVPSRAVISHGRWGGWHPAEPRSAGGHQCSSVECFLLEHGGGSPSPGPGHHRPRHGGPWCFRLVAGRSRAVHEGSGVWAPSPRPLPSSRPVAHLPDTQAAAAWAAFRAVGIFRSCGGRRV